MNSFITELQHITFSIQNNLHFVLGILAIFWIINILNFLLHYRLNIFGIVPRSRFGIVGIFFSPFLHAGFGHLFFNSIPLFILINLMLLHGLVTFYFVSVVIIVLGGAAVWLFGKPGIHVGASGLVMGYFGYLFANAYHQPTIFSIILAVVCLYYFGGAIMFALFSAEKGSSWAGHFFGFFAGIAAAYLSNSLILWG